MEQFRRLSLGKQLILGGGVLLLIDTFLPWQKISVLGFSHSWSAWHGFWGVIMGLATVVLVVWVAARIFEIAIPVDLPDGLTTLGLAALILAFAVIKNLADDYSAWGSYVGIVLAAVVGYGAWLNFGASGESLPSQRGHGSHHDASPSNDDAPPEGTSAPGDPV
jgi:hypothetical protein